jgi:hypothetical protein
MSDVLMALAAFGALGLAAFALIRQRGLQEALQDARRRLYLTQARLTELERSTQQEWRALRATMRRQAGGRLFEPSMRIADAIAIDPRVRDVLAQFHLGGCRACAIDEEHTIEQAAASSGVDLEHLMAALEAVGNEQPPMPRPSQPRRLLQLEEL